MAGPVPLRVQLSPTPRGARHENSFYSLGSEPAPLPTTSATLVLSRRRGSQSPGIAGSTETPRTTMGNQSSPGARTSAIGPRLQPHSGVLLQLSIERDRSPCSTPLHHRALGSTKTVKDVLITMCKACPETGHLKACSTRSELPGAQSQNPSQAEAKPKPKRSQSRSRSSKLKSTLEVQWVVQVRKQAHRLIPQVGSESKSEVRSPRSDVRRPTPAPLLLRDLRAAAASNMLGS
jgi:hypothetical protein